LQEVHLRSLQPAIQRSSKIMASTKFDCPFIWDYISSFLDVPVSGLGADDLDDYGKRLDGYNRGERIHQALSSHVEPARSCLDGGMYSVGAVRAYVGDLSYGREKRASMFEEVLAQRADYDQAFPMTHTTEDGDEITLDPGFNARGRMDSVNLPWDGAVADVARLLSGRIVNPHNYLYRIRKLGNDEQVARLPREERQAVLAKRRWLQEFKADLVWKLVVLGNIPGAYAQSVTSTKYEKLFWWVFGSCMNLILWVLECCRAALVGGCARAVKAYGNSSDEVQALLDLITLFVLLAVAYHLVWGKAPKLAQQSVSKKGDCFLGQVLTEKGMTYRVRVNGKEITLSATGAEVAVTHQDEMSMPGSEYFPCRNQPVGAILTATADSDLRLFGTFWRMDDYFITARHCSNTLNQSTARVYLAKLKQTKRGNFEVDLTATVKVDDGFFDPERNIIAHYDIDAFVSSLEAKEWARIGVTKASTKVRSAYNQQIHSVGFTTDGLLVSASGKTLPNSGHELLHHTASTQKGFSGSIILCGNSVIGMHVSAAGSHNVAIRVELLKYLIDVGLNQESNKRGKFTYADASYREYYREHKYRGGVGDLMKTRDGKFSIVLRNGEATYGWSMKQLAECFGPYGNYTKDEDYFQDMYLKTVGIAKRTRGNYHVDFDDENVPIKEQKPIQDRLYTIETGYKAGHGPSQPLVQPEILKVIENNKEEIVALGYEEGSFAYPEMNPEMEKKSIVGHLKLFAKRLKACVQPPTKDEMARCARIVARMLQPAAFVPRSNYKTIDGLADIINSSTIQETKAAGYPYAEQGMPLNKQVIEKFSVRGFAQLVLNEWDNLQFDIKLFLKGEPNKLKKLKSFMARCIAGLPLHVTVKHASVFLPFAEALVKNWKKIPVKYAFSPANTGAIEHLKQCLPGKVWESDKSTWDFNYFYWIAQICGDVTKFLAIKPAEWTEEQFDEYKRDVDQCIEQVFTNSRYRTSDGTVYVVEKDGIMKSGWFNTISFNSIAQLVVHVLCCMRLGMEEDDIVDLAIVAGGDDVNQEPVPAGKEAYVDEARKLGIDMEIHEREDLYQSEYFSSDLRMGKDGPEFYPKRWTKHIENLKTVKIGDLASALVSHMENYRHDVPKFRLLQKIYHELRESYPAEFPISRLVSRDMLLARQYGYECNHW